MRVCASEQSTLTFNHIVLLATTPFVTLKLTHDEKRLYVEKDFTALVSPDKIIYFDDAHRKFIQSAVNNTLTKPVSS